MNRIFVARATAPTRPTPELMASLSRPLPKAVLRAWKSRVHAKVATTNTCPDGEIDVRLATPADAPRLAEFGGPAFIAAHRDAFDPRDLHAYAHATFDEDALLLDLTRSNTRVLAAEMADRVMGMAMLCPDPAPSCVTGERPVELTRFYLDLACVGSGAGAALMRHALLQAAADGYATIWLTVWAGNLRARAFYAKWGFVEVGEQLMRVGRSAVPTLVMSRPLMV